MVQNSTKKQRNIIIASIIIVVLIISSITTWIILYEPSKVKQVPTSLNLHVSLNQSNVLQGNNLQAEVNVTLIGKAENITLGSNVGSSGIVCSYDPATDTSNFTSLLTINVPDSTPTGNYTIFVTASSGGALENASCSISVLSSTIAVSGTVGAGGFLNFNVGLNYIEFIDNQTNVKTVVGLPSPYPVTTWASSTYSVILQNEHTYQVTASVNVLEPTGITYTFAAVTFYVYAPAGNNTITEKNFTFGF